MRREILMTAGFMAATVSPAGRADQIFRIGPETLVAESFAIYSGEVSSLSKHIVTVSQPGDGTMPLTWTVNGSLDRPEALKGTARGPIRFSREERAFALPPPPDQPQWQADYGDLLPGDRAVIFETGDAVHPQTKVLPSGPGERDLITLVRDIVAVQALTPRQAQISAWVAYLLRTKLDTGRQAALRSLLQAGAEWSTIAPAAQQLFRDYTVSDKMRAYTFGFIAFGVMQNLWGDSAPAAVDLLCREFEGESRPQVALQYILHMKLLLRYSTEEAAQATRQPLRSRIVDALKRAHASGAKSSELAQQYEQIQAAYPGLW